MMGYPAYVGRSSINDSMVVISRKLDISRLASISVFQSVQTMARGSATNDFQCGAREAYCFSKAENSRHKEIVFHMIVRKPGLAR